MKAVLGMLVLTSRRVAVTRPAQTRRARRVANTGQISAKAQQDLVSEGIENFELPKSIVAKIAKSAVRGITSLCLRRLSDNDDTATVVGKCKAAKGDGSVACNGFDGVYKLFWCVERLTVLCDGSLGLM